MAYNDDELTLEELKEITAGVKIGKTDEMLNKLSKPELTQLKDAVTKDREFSLEELDNVKAGIPKEMVEKNSNIFK